MELTGTDNAVLEGESIPLDDTLPDDNPEVFEGDGWADKAVAALEQKRAEAARRRPVLEDEDEGDPGLTKVRWQDGRPEDKPITLREAQRDYAKYRADLARTIVEGVQADWDAAAAQEGAQPAEQQQAEQTESSEAEFQKYFESLPKEQQAHVVKAAEYEQRTQQTTQVADAYLMALTNLLGNVNGQTNAQFNDVKNVDDVSRMAHEDPARFEVLRAQMAQAAAIYEEAGRVNQARQELTAARNRELFQIFAAEEDKKVGLLVPELRADADPEVRGKLQRASVDALRAVGFSDAELTAAWRDGAGLSIHDARAQAIIADAARWRMANSPETRKQLANKRAHAPRPQRPGVSSGVAAYQDERKLAERLQKSGSVHDAVSLYRARLGRR